MSKQQEMVQIPADKLQKLLDSEMKLYYLKAYGVDNWEGYDLAMEDYYKEVEDSESE